MGRGVEIKTYLQLLVFYNMFDLISAKLSLYSIYIFVCIFSCDKQLYISDAWLSIVTPSLNQWGRFIKCLLICLYLCQINSNLYETFNRSFWRPNWSSQVFLSRVPTLNGYFRSWGIPKFALFPYISANWTQIFTKD